MRSSVLKRSILFAGHKTSISLEDELWKCLREIAGEQRESVSGLVAKIDEARNRANLSSAIRMYVLKHYCDLVDQRKVETSAQGLGSNSFEHRTK